MKKLNFWLLASLFVTAFTLTACGEMGSAAFIWSRYEYLLCLRPWSK